jgi:hypothetical protein
LALGLLGACHANVLVYESFGDIPGSATVNGYQTTTAGLSTGLSGAWSLQQGSNQSLTRNTSGDWNPAQSTNGHPMEQNGGFYHYWEATGGNWGVQRTQAPLATGIDMSSDGTWYMSFFYKGGNIDSIWQAGLNDGTDELMWGQGYGANGSSQGVDAFYQAVGGGAGGSSNLNPPFNSWTAQFFVAKLVKSDSANTDTLTVSLISYNLGATNFIASSDPMEWLYTKTLTGVDNTFTNLQLKVGGPNGSWPAIDEIRVGTTWNDVTGVSTAASPPAIVTGPPASVNGLVGGSVQITAVVSGTPTPDFQWQVSTDAGANWTNLPDENSPSLTLSGLTLPMSGNLYRLYASNAGGNVTSDTAELFMSYPDPQITTQPVSITADAGTSAPITVVASGADETNFPLEYQWQRSSDLGGTWADLPGETAATLSFASVAPSDSDLYRVVMTDPAGTQDSFPATQATSNTAYLRVTDPSQGFVYAENGTMVYDGLGADAAIDPHQVFDDDINIGSGTGNTGMLTVNSGTLSLINWTTWSIKVGQDNGTATVTVNGGTLNIRDAGGDNEARVILGNGNSNASLILDGGDVNVSVGADDDGERGFYICRDSATGTGTIDLVSGTLTYGSNAPVRIGASTGGDNYGGSGLIKVGNGSMVISGTSNVMFGANDFMDFVVGGSGSIAIFGWDSTNDPGLSRFKALVDNGNVKIAGVVATAGDYSPFIFSDGLGGIGVMKLDPNFTPPAYTTWATANAGGQGANGDFDFDGTPNGVEYFMNAAAGFTPNPGVAGGTVTWPNGGNIPSAEYGMQFKVQTSPNLVGWSDVAASASGLSNTAGSVSFTLPEGEQKLFVRLVVTPN